MTAAPAKITLHDWTERYETLCREGMTEPHYGGPIRRHIDDGDFRLSSLHFDNSPAALRLWNFLLTEEERLYDAEAKGKKIVGAMKDLGTVPVMAYSLPDVVAFYPDGAWWIPCVMELSAGLMGIADSLGIDDSFCPVRAMLGAFLKDAHYPTPHLLTCNVGATCDDFSAIAQRLNGLGHLILWWESPHRRRPDPGEEAVTLPGGFEAPKEQVELLIQEFDRMRRALEKLTGSRLDDAALAEGIRTANKVRSILFSLRNLAYKAEPCPLPALEMLIAEMLAIHFCSDREECIAVLEDLLAEVKERVEKGMGVLAADAARIFWVNPVADLRAMNLLEDCGGRICGTEYLFSHALDAIPEDLPPVEALARMSLADPMTGPISDRADRILRDAERFGAEACLVSRIPGASHCVVEARIIKEKAAERGTLPVLEIEVPPVSDAMMPALRNRMEALVETIKGGRKARSSPRVCGTRAWSRTAWPGSSISTCSLNMISAKSRYRRSCPRGTAGTFSSSRTARSRKSPAMPRASGTRNPRPAPSSRSGARTARWCEWTRRAWCRTSS
jgi:benzoyl-CoA reductase/2-hydroxyglutaryl-CoA dehydratase subunit BcrC/BadD/HgdB